MNMDKLRIVQRGVNDFAIQQKVLWFWIDHIGLEFNYFWTLEEARDCIKKWAADEAASGKVFAP